MPEVGDRVQVKYGKDPYDDKYSDLARCRAGEQGVVLKKEFGLLTVSTEGGKEIISVEKAWEPVP